MKALILMTVASTLIANPTWAETSITSTKIECNLSSSEENQMVLFELSQGAVRSMRVSADGRSVSVEGRQIPRFDVSKKDKKFIAATGKEGVTIDAKDGNHIIAINYKIKLPVTTEGEGYIEKNDIHMRELDDSGNMDGKRKRIARIADCIPARDLN